MWSQTSRGLPIVKRNRKKGTGPSKTHCLHPLWDVGLLFGMIHSEWFWLPSQKMMLFGFHMQGVLALHIIFLPRANDFHSLKISKQVFKKPRKKKMWVRVFWDQSRRIFLGMLMPSTGSNKQVPKLQFLRNEMNQTFASLTLSGLELTALMNILSGRQDQNKERLIFSAVFAWPEPHIRSTWSFSLLLEAVLDDGAFDTHWVSNSTWNLASFPLMPNSTVFCYLSFLQRYKKHLDMI